MAISSGGELNAFELFVNGESAVVPVARELTIAQLHAGVDASGNKRVGRRERQGSSSGDELSDEDIEDHWDLLERCWRLYYGMCMRKARGKRCLADELMGEVIDRLPRLVESWDPTMGVPLRPYVINSLAWYLHKYVKRAQRDATRFQQLEQTGADGDGFEPGDRTHDVACDRAERDKTRGYNTESVEDLLSRLSEDERLAIETCVMEGEAVSELADLLGVNSREAARVRREAIAKVRRLAAMDIELDEDLRELNR